MAQQEIGFEVEFTTAGLLHTPSIESFTGEGDEKKATNKAGYDPDEWRKAFLRTRTGELALTSRQFRASILEASKGMRKGRGSMFMKFTSTLMVQPALVPLGVSIGKADPPVFDYGADFAYADMPKVVIDRRPVRNPATRGTNIRSRVAFAPGTRATINVSFDDSILTPPQVREAVDAAGRLHGVGDGRKLGYGRFVVVPAKNGNGRRKTTARKASRK